MAQIVRFRCVGESGDGLPLYTLDNGIVDGQSALPLTFRGEITVLSSTPDDIKAFESLVVYDFNAADTEDEDSD